MRKSRLLAKGLLCLSAVSASALLYAQTCSVVDDGNGGRSLADAVFNVFEGGDISIGGESANGTCNVTFSGSSDLNVQGSRFSMHGTGSDGDPCLNADTQEVMSATDENPERLELPAFPGDVRSKHISYQTANQISVSGVRYESCSQGQNRYWRRQGSNQCNSAHAVSEIDGVVLPVPDSAGAITITNAPGENVYGDIQLGNGMPVEFRSVSDAPFIVGSLSLAGGCNSGIAAGFEPGEYFLRGWSQQAGCGVAVLGTGRVDLHFESTTTLNGGRTCINFSACNSNTPAVTGQHPERLALYVHDGDLHIQNNMHIAAAVYVHDGDLILGTGPLSYVGEALANNVIAQNNTQTHFRYQDTGLFDPEIVETPYRRPGEFSLSAPAVPLDTRTGDFVYIASQTEHPAISGHLRAFALRADGTTATDSAWDAAARMTVDERRQRLYSNDADGDLVLFDALDDGAFQSSGTPNVAQIKAYTVDPGYGGGDYLAGRAADSLMGAPYTTQPVILGDRVLVQTDDGFLYAFDRSSGELAWGWMPRPLVAGLRHYESFHRSHPMHGQLSAFVAADGAGYVIGTADGGALHYLLSVDGSGALLDLLWLDERGGSSPHAHAPIVYLAGGQPYAAYVAGNDVISRALAAGPGEAVYRPSGEANGAVLTAEPIAVERYEVSNQGDVLRHVELYLGAADGNVYVGELVNEDRRRGAGNLAMELVGNVGAATSVGDAVLFLESSDLGGVDYLLAQTASRLKTFRFHHADNEAHSGWVGAWTSFVGGGGVWDHDGQHYAESDSVQVLPENARISARLQLAAGVVMLPLTLESGQACENQAYLYLYDLANGGFPHNVLYRRTTAYGNIHLGSGAAYTPQLTRLNGEWIAEGHSDQNRPDDGGNIELGLDDPLLFPVQRVGGRAGWREIFDE